MTGRKHSVSCDQIRCNPVCLKAQLPSGSEVTASANPSEVKHFSTCLAKGEVDALVTEKWMWFILERHDAVIPHAVHFSPNGYVSVV